MPRPTRNVDIEELRDLLDRPGRAALASVRDGVPVVVPACLRWTENQWRVGVDPSHGRLPAAGDEVVLVVDEGRQFFDLRAAFVRGLGTPTEPMGQTPDELEWIEVAPTMVVGWDYGRMRYADHDPVVVTDRSSSERGTDGRG